jgi:hypothetical protein
MRVSGRSRRAFRWLPILLFVPVLAGCSPIVVTPSPEPSASRSEPAVTATDDPLTPAWNRPARFEVTSTVASPDPGPFTATMAAGPVNTLLTGGSFEPSVFRQRTQALVDGTGRIDVARSDADGWDTWREGFWDGATVRVFRIVDGKFVQTLTDTVRAGGHRASGWNDVLDGKLIPPGARQFVYAFDPWERPGVTYYFTVKAVGVNGAESPVASWVSLKNSSLSGDVGKRTLVDFQRPDEPVNVAPPSGVKNVTAAVDKARRLVTFRWSGVPGKHVVGYRLYRSEYAPSRHRGYGFDLGDQTAEIRAGDMVFLDLKRYDWSREKYFTSRVWEDWPSSGEPPLVPTYSDEMPGGSWAFVPYDTPPPFSDGAETSLRIQIPNDGAEHKIFQYNHAGTWQQWYPVLRPGRTYNVEVWMRQEGMAAPNVAFRLESFYGDKIAPTGFTVDGTWRKYTTTFTPRQLWQDESSIGTMGLYFTGPGTLWLDNFRIYAADTPFMDLPATEYAALAESGIGAIRTHDLVKTGFGYTADSLTDPAGVLELSGHDARTHNLASLLGIMDRAHVDPWLQLELFLSRDEWLGVAEYLAAPYDPAVDTPQSKPWAYKRYAQGQTAPWAGQFDRIYLELSNETWNPMFRPWMFNWLEMTDARTGAKYESGQLYGLYQEYVISVFKASPYYAALAPKLEWVLGGWTANTDESGYGQTAAVSSPGSAWMTVAMYNGGWDEGAAPASPNDEGYFKVLTYVPQSGLPDAQALAETRANQVATGTTSHRLGTYEAGPGYSLPGTITDAQTEAEARVMKSQAAGAATLDSFLANASLGFGLQNFFTFGRGRNGWTSHARETDGGQAYPAWKTLAMYNKHGTGDFLVTRTLSVPTCDLAATTERAAMSAAPMVAVYATRNGNRYSVFVISRKLDGYPVAGDDGYTPVTIGLPFDKAAEITLYKMAGDPRANNLDSDAVKVTSERVSTDAFSREFVIDSRTGASPKGLPPGSVFLYVFEVGAS